MKKDIMIIIFTVGFILGMLFGILIMGKTVYEDLPRYDYWCNKSDMEFKDHSFRYVNCENTDDVIVKYPKKPIKESISISYQFNEDKED